MAKRASRQPNRRSSRRLMLGARAVPQAAPRAIPTWWLNTLIGVFLLPVAWLLTVTFFGSFSRAALEHEFWLTDEFWFFGLGAVLWSLWFAGSIWSMGEPRPLRAYVFGHELTHAIWVWLLGGRVAHFEVSREGGYILTDTHNVWVALAPYFYPIYSLAVILLYGAASFFYDVAGSHATLLWVTPLQWLFLLLGITWAFHLSFTCWMIPKGQSDLSAHGTFYSLVFIYLMNIAVLSVFLVAVAPELTWADYGRDLLTNAESMASAVASLAGRFSGSAKSF